MGVNDNNVIFEDVRIIWRNFAGEQKQFNAEGDRNFHLVLTEEQASTMAEHGWNVKTKEPREEGDSPLYVLKVKVSFKGRTPPRLILISSRGRTTLNEDLAMMLDWAELQTVDLIVRPYDWNIKSTGKTGRTAYLHSIYATQMEDELSLKYADKMEIDDKPAFVAGDKFQVDIDTDD